MKQTATTEFLSNCGKARIYVENDIQVGIFHDFLMHVKGLMVDKMVKTHAEEEQVSKSMQEQPTNIEE